MHLYLICHFNYQIRPLVSFPMYDVKKDSCATTSITFARYCVLFSAPFKEGKITFIHAGILYEIIFQIYFSVPDLKGARLSKFLFTLRKKKKQKTNKSVKFYEYVEAFEFLWF